jgi:hypothetical protein
MKKYPIKSQKEIRRLFWQEHPNADRRKITDYSGKGKMYKTDTRVLFSNFIDTLLTSDQISPKLAQKSTL